MINVVISIRQTEYSGGKIEQARTATLAGNFLHPNIKIILGEILVYAHKEKRVVMGKTSISLQKTLHPFILACRKKIALR